MIDKVAWAICGDDCLKCDPSILCDYYWPKSARAAIEAMREPTDGMLEAGWRNGMTALGMWQAMIDEALKTPS